MYLRVGTLAAILAAAASAFPLAEVGDGEAPAGLARSMQPGAAVDKRDGRTNCGSRDAYVSVDTFNQKVEAYCSAAAGINIAKGSQHSNSYEVHLTNQEDPDKPGLLGRVIFMIKNESRDPNYKVEHDRCVFSMRKSSNPDSKCYGAKNHDTRGGSWKVDGIGHFDNRVEKGGF